MTQPAPTPAIWPQPLDGYLDVAPIQINLSMRAAVTLAVGGKVTTYRLNAGPRTLTWTPPAGLAPGTYPVQVSALSYAGHRKTVTLAPIVVGWDTTPPPIAATLTGTTLSWQANEPGTPWLALAIDLVDPAAVNPPQTLDLGRLPTTGTTQVAIPTGTWQATLRATNSAGLTAPYPLGTIIGPG